MGRMLAKFAYRHYKLLTWLNSKSGTPGYRAKGLAIGVFSGCFPLFGFQVILGIVLARVLKGHYLIAAAATWISNPLTYVPLYWFNYKVGSIFLGNIPNIIQDKSLSYHYTINLGWSFISRLLFGSFCVASILSFLVGVVSYKVFSLRNK